MSIEFKYELEEAGWANAIIFDNSQKENYLAMTVSYLFDSLKNLVESVIELLESQKDKTVIFMSEPGEHQMLLSISDENLNIEIRWYDDWASWNMYPKDQYEIVFKGTTSLKYFAENILDCLEKIYLTYGLSGYKENWIEHDFPYNQYRKLKRKICRLAN